jgi:hypothetical protein
MNKTALALIGAALILALSGCTPAADDAAAPEPAATEAVVAQSPEPAPEPEITYYPAPACWNIVEPAGYQYRSAVTPEEGLANYEAEHGEGSAAEKGVSFTCSMNTEPGQDLTAARTWIDELVAQGWIESTRSGEGEARHATSPDYTVTASYVDFGEAGLSFYLMPANRP